MPISELHASHIGRVAVSFSVSGPTVNPDAITARLGITSVARCVAPDCREMGHFRPVGWPIGQPTGLRSRGAVRRAIARQLRLVASKSSSQP